MHGPHLLLFVQKKKPNTVNIYNKGPLLYCMHVRLCMLNVSVEASRFKKAVIYLFSYLGELNVTLCCFGLSALNGLFSTKKIKLRSNCNLLSYYHRRIFNYICALFMLH